MPASKRPPAFLAFLAFVAFLASLARRVHPAPAGRPARCILPITRLLMLGSALLLGAPAAHAQLACTPVAPVPMMPTRLPRSSTPSSGQRAVWKLRPAKTSRPGYSGSCGAESVPAAAMR